MYICHLCNCISCRIVEKSLTVFPCKCLLKIFIIIEILNSNYYVFLYYIEKGNFLALDLGGTNFRVLLITLDGQKSDMKSKIYAIPQSLMLGTGTQLFDHIAQCLALFVKDLNLQNEILPLGFTFSFPLTQHGLTKGQLVRWTKGFNCSGVIGEDVVSLLEEAINRRKVSVRVSQAKK